MNLYRLYLLNCGLLGAVTHHIYKDGFESITPYNIELALLAAVVVTNVVSLFYLGVVKKKV